MCTKLTYSQTLFFLDRHYADEDGPMRIKLWQFFIEWLRYHGGGFAAAVIDGDDSNLVSVAPPICDYTFTSDDPQESKRNALGLVGCILAYL